MSENLNQAKHNESFLALIEGHCPDGYFDWKITVVFYSALHYLRALEKSKKSKINGTHRDLIYHINPRNNDAKMKLDQKVSDCYQDLFNLAHTARYSGMKDLKNQLALLKFNLDLSKSHLEVIKKYVLKNL